ncbi:unnamed protein product [Microthlaspi erraticum]|uniref:Uncharacterized protein n=1 Tax=Microthlaspi erraticum TaxID=1685480 RepID=A0A6D2L085_9BRAS|nr:unnamed protein product [Microthlaspi erraticum]
MDFIKTSSLRALIELTFQRNWNGLIWMSRKGVTTKRVKTVQTALSRKRPTAQSGWPRNECFALGQIIRPSEVSAKVPNLRPITSRPGKHVPRSAKPRHSRHAAHDQPREPGTSLAAAQPSRVPRPMRRPSREDVPRPAENIGQSSPSDHSGRPRIRPATTVPTRP